MPPNLTENERKVYEYLLKIAPKWATNTEIEEATRVQPHQQVFQITQRLMHRGLILGEQGRYREKEWVFSARPEKLRELGNKPVLLHAANPPANPEIVGAAAKRPLIPAQFERLAEQVMSRHFGQPLHHGTPPGVPKEFDLVSADGSIVGDAKYFTLVRGVNLPSAKLSVVSEYVWLLEKTQARYRFLVFGNQRAVPDQWLQHYGCLVENVEFYFLTDDGRVERLK